MESFSSRPLSRSFSAGQERPCRAARPYPVAPSIPTRGKHSDARETRDEPSLSATFQALLARRKRSETAERRNAERCSALRALTCVSSAVVGADALGSPPDPRRRLSAARRGDPCGRPLIRARVRPASVAPGIARGRPARGSPTNARRYGRCGCAAAFRLLSQGLIPHDRNMQALLQPGGRGAVPAFSFSRLPADDRIPPVLHKMWCMIATKTTR